MSIKDEMYITDELQCLHGKTSTQKWSFSHSGTTITTALSVIDVKSYLHFV